MAVSWLIIKISYFYYCNEKPYFMQIIILIKNSENSIIYINYEY